MFLEDPHVLRVGDAPAPIRLGVAVGVERRATDFEVGRRDDDASWRYQVPVAVVSDVTSISGWCPWCSVTISGPPSTSVSQSTMAARPVKVVLPSS